MDDKIIGLYAAGLTVRDIRAHLEELYGLKVSADLINGVTDEVLDEVREWQSRALDRMYPIVMFDALRVKIRDSESRMVRSSPWKPPLVRGPWRTQSTSPSVSHGTVHARFWACGLPIMKARNSGYR